MTIIFGTNGDDILIGDGLSQILGGAGSDVIYLTGAKWEGLFDPGADLYRVKSVGQFSDVGFDLALRDGFQASSSTVWYNFTGGSISAGNRTIARYSSIDAWGYVDTFEFSEQVKRLDLKAGPLNDNIYTDSIYVHLTVDLGEDNGWDKLFSPWPQTVNIKFKENDALLITQSSGGYLVQFKNGNLELLPSSVWSSGGRYSLWPESRYPYTASQIDVQGSPAAESFTLWGGSATIKTGGGKDTFTLAAPSTLVINNYDQSTPLLAIEKWYFREFGLEFSGLTADNFRRWVNVTHDARNLTTDISITNPSGGNASKVTIDGLMDIAGLNKTANAFEISLQSTSQTTNGIFAGYQSKPGRWLLHDLSKPLSLTNYPDLVSFEAPRIQYPITVSEFKSGVDLIHLWSNTAPAGGWAGYNLKPINFASGVGLTKPKTALEYVIYDTSTGVVYFDQDGNGPSPTWAAAIFSKGTQLVFSDFQISKPQTYALESDRLSTNEGDTVAVRLTSTNVAAGGSVPYSITGVSSFDLTGAKLTGSVMVDANGEAVLKIPVGADGITEGQETMVLSAGGQTLSILVNDTSRSASDPGYSLSVNSASVNEGAAAVFVLTTKNVPSGTAVPYTVSGVSGVDVTGGALVGNALVDSTGRATISIPIAADSLTEGPETLVLTAGGVSAYLTVNDTSLTKLLDIPASYALVRSVGGYGISPVLSEAMPPSSDAFYVVRFGNTWTPEFRASVDAVLKLFADNRNSLGLSTDQALGWLDANLRTAAQPQAIEILGLLGDIEPTRWPMQVDGRFNVPVIGVPNIDWSAGGDGGGGGGGGGSG